jgi:DNA primase
MFNQELLSEIRDRTPISSFIGERIPLKKSGRNFKGLCPFHQEKTPSFMVSEEKQIFHCFGCGEGGDVFTFLMKYEGLNFTEAVKQLAEQAGVKVPESVMREKGPDAEAARRKKWCLRVNEIANEWFQGRLATGEIGEIARNYLISRGIKSEIWTQLNLGTADKSWDALKEHLASKGVPLKLAAEMGLLRERNSGDGYYDFFRGRLIFPIFSPRGEVIAFGGRVLDESDEVKYINSPDSMIFHKSMSVYGLNWAAEHIRHNDRAIIVEGYMDVLGLTQAGIGGSVAPLGTSLTSGHIRLISRLTRNMVLIFDGDDAGIKAALRSLPLFMDVGIIPRTVMLPRGEDPDSFVRSEGKQALDQLVDRAESLIEVYFDRTIAETGRDSAGKAKALSALVPIIKKMGEPAQQGVHRHLLADKLDIPESVVREAMGRNNTSAMKKVTGSEQKDRVLVPSAERTLVELMVQNPEAAPKVLEQISPDDFGDGFSESVASMFAQHVKGNSLVNLSEILDDLGDPEMERELRGIAMDEEKIPANETDRAIADCVGAIKARAQQQEMRELNEKIRTAEKEGNEKQLFDLLRRKKEMTTIKQVNQNHI